MSRNTNKVIRNKQSINNKKVNEPIYNTIIGIDSYIYRGKASRTDMKEYGRLPSQGRDCRMNQRWPRDKNY